MKGLERVLASIEGRKIIAIDGRSAAGKTTLAEELLAVTGGDILHMDDFFLPPELRTAQRYSEPGGNIHRERFQEEKFMPDMVLSIMSRSSDATVTAVTPSVPRSLA